MVLTSTKFPNGIEIFIGKQNLFRKKCFIMLTETPQVVMVITQGFADYLKQEPDFEKAFIEYKAIIEKEEADEL